MWKKAASAVELVSTLTILVNSARPRAPFNIYPTGCCMNALAARIKYAESSVPVAASQIDAKCNFFGKRSQPNIHIPKKVLSRKKASRPSIASGAPKISPTKRLYEDQFIPNWNSCTIPVTTPIAKLIRNSFPKNLVARRYLSLLVRYQAVWNPATRNPEPIVSGTKIK